jgi:hypothetical protein
MRRKPRFSELVKNKDIDLVRKSIQEKYGFIPPDEYIKDLIVFVQEMMNGVTHESGSDRGDDPSLHPERHLIGS